MPGLLIPNSNSAARRHAPGPRASVIDFVRHVQPVFDKHCVKCHSGADPKGGIDLSGDKTRYFNMAYDTLTEKGLVHYIYINRGLTDVFRPMETGSHRSKLVQRIESGRCKVEVDDNGLRRLYTWIDANCPYYGTYANTRPGTPGSRDLWTGPWFRTLTDALRAAKLPTRLKHGDINLSHPEWSSVLTTRLAKDAGGRAETDRAFFKATGDPRGHARQEMKRSYPPCRRLLELQLKPPHRDSPLVRGRDPQRLCSPVQRDADRFSSPP